MFHGTKYELPNSIEDVLYNHIFNMYDYHSTLLRTLQESVKKLYAQRFKDAGIMSETYYVTFANKPTAEQKFTYMYDLLTTLNKLPTSLFVTSTKSNTTSRSLRDKANEQFQNKYYISAVYGYNLCIMNAEIGSEDYALALANRSASLYYLKEYNDCICDIHLALAAKYPKERCYKLYEREVKCLRKLRKISQAKLKFKEFLLHLTHAILPTENKKDIEMQLRLFLKEFNDEKRSDDTKNIIRLLGGPNKNIPTLSKFVKLKYSESMGRCLVVTSDINPGDVLAIEKSYAGALIAWDSFGKNCHYCFKRCLSGIPCPKCPWVIYCDETCRIKSYECVHKYECEILTMYLTWPNMESTHLTLVIFLKTIHEIGLDKYVSTVRTLNADTTDSIMRGFNSNGKYLSDQFISVYTLEGNEAKRSVGDLFTRYYYAATMVSFLKLAGIKIPDHQLGIVGESLLHIICVVSSNAHEIAQPAECNAWNLNSKRSFPVASVLMPVLSLFNHHCDPNVVRHNYNGTIVVRAIKPISKDSQLFDNYGNLFAVQTKETRQLNLYSQYLFHCRCESCEDNWPIYEVLLNRPISERIMLTNIDSAVLDENQKKLYDIISEMNMNRNGDCLCYIQFLYSHLTFLYKNIKTPWRDCCECQEVIKEILFTTADKFVIKYN